MSGSADSAVRVWNTRTQQCEKKLDVGGEVIGIHFSQWTQQFVTVQGDPTNELNLWTFPHFKKLATLEGHDQRIVHSIAKGEHIVTLGECEQMKFWQTFSAPEVPRNRRLSQGMFGSWIR